MTHDGHDHETQEHTMQQAGLARVLSAVHVAAQDQMALASDDQTVANMIVLLDKVRVILTPFAVEAPGGVPAVKAARVALEQLVPTPKPGASTKAHCPPRYEHDSNGNCVWNPYGMLTD